MPRVGAQSVSAEGVPRVCGDFVHPIVPTSTHFALPSPGAHPNGLRALAAHRGRPQNAMLHSLRQRLLPSESASFGGVPPTPSALCLRLPVQHNCAPPTLQAPLPHDLLAAHQAWLMYVEGHELVHERRMMRGHQLERHGRSQYWKCTHNPDRQCHRGRRCALCVACGAQALRSADACGGKQG